MFPRNIFKSLVLVFALMAAALTAAADAGGMSSEVKELDQIPRLHPEYPVPAEPHQLFYIERSSNSNTVVYAANLDQNGKLSQDEPVVAFWRWYHGGGHKKDLNFAERMMAYGIKTVRHDGPNGSYSFKVAAMPERTLYAGLDAKGNPEVFTRMGTHWATLSYVYLQVVDKGLLPDVPSLDLFGIDRESGKALHEHLVRK